MKKILYLFFTCSIIFAFAGCSPSKKDSAEATTTHEIATTTSTTENTTDSSTSDSDAKDDSYDFSAYKKRIKKLTKKVNNAASSSNASVNEKRFYTLKKELDVVEHKVYRRRTRLVLVVEGSILLLALYFQLDFVTKSIVIAYFIVSVSLLMGLISNKSKQISVHKI